MKNIKEPSKKEKLSREREAYFIAKEKAILFERTNYDKIVFFRGTKNHFVACDHSALIFYHLVLPKIRIELEWHKDRDHSSHTDRFNYGFISIVNLDKYIERIKSLKFIKEIPKKTDDRLIFTLKEPISPEQIDEFAHAEEIARDKLISAISSNPKSLPKTFVALRMLYSETRIMVNKRCDAIDRITTTYRLLNLAHDAFATFITGCRHKTQFEKSMDAVEKNLSEILIELLATEAAGIWSISECERISYATSNALMHLKNERKKHRE